MKVNGGALRAIREARNISQRGLAQRVTCSHSLVSRFESGERGKRYVVDPDLVRRMAECLGVTVAAITMSDDQDAA